MLPTFPPPSTGVKKTWSSGQLGPIRSRLQSVSVRLWQRRWQGFQGGRKTRRACPTGQWKTLRRESGFSGVPPYTGSSNDPLVRCFKFKSLKGWKQ